MYQETSIPWHIYFTTHKLFLHIEYTTLLLYFPLTWKHGFQKMCLPRPTLCFLRPTQDTLWAPEPSRLTKRILQSWRNFPGCLKLPDLGKHYTSSIQTWMMLPGVLETQSVAGCWQWGANTPRPHKGWWKITASKLISFTVGLEKHMCNHNE